MLRTLIALFVVAAATFTAVAPGAAHACGGYGDPAFFLEHEVQRLKASRTHVTSELELALRDAREDDIDALVAQLTSIQQQLAEAEEALEATRAESQLDVISSR